MTALTAVPSFTDDAPGERKKRIRKFAESYQSLLVYAALVGAGGPMTARELLDSTGVADATLYPILQKRLRSGVLVDSERSGLSAYDFTPAGYEIARKTLLSLEQLTGGTAGWVRQDRRFAPSPAHRPGTGRRSR